MYIFFSYYTKIYNQLVLLLLWFYICLLSIYLLTCSNHSFCVCLKNHLNLITWGLFEWGLSNMLHKEHHIIITVNNKTKPSFFFLHLHVSMSVNCVHMGTGVVKVLGCILLIEWTVRTLKHFCAEYFIKNYFYEFL